jgi:hypothetical protein
MTVAPRAQRFPAAMRVLWRPSGVTAWFEGLSVNTSRSGVLFRTDSGASIGTRVDLLLPMGHEDPSSHAAADVLCAGRIVRAEASADVAGRTALAATIDTYEFLPRATTM